MDPQILARRDPQELDSQSIETVICVSASSSCWDMGDLHVKFGGPATAALYPKELQLYLSCCFGPLNSCLLSRSSLTVEEEAQFVTLPRSQCKRRAAVQASRKTTQAEWMIQGPW